MILSQEKAKYEDVWQLADYRAHSPGAEMAAKFVEIMRLEKDYVVDFGCGAGEGTRALRAMGMIVTPVDFVRVEGAPEGLVEACIWKPMDLHVPAPRGAVGYCVDVMEHIPEPLTMLAVARMLEVCSRGVFLCISFAPDNLGAAIGETLHMTVRPFTWWRDHLAEVGRLVHARDLLGSGVFVVE